MPVIFILEARNDSNPKYKNLIHFFPV